MTGVCRNGGQVNHLSEAWIQVSDCPVSGSRTEKETQAGSHQMADTRNCNICTKVPDPHGLGVRLK